MLTVAEETLARIAEKRGLQIASHLYGQEINPETYAVCKADMLLKGERASSTCAMWRRGCRRKPHPTSSRTPPTWMKRPNPLTRRSPRDHRHQREGPRNADHAPYDRSRRPHHHAKRSGRGASALWRHR